MHGGAAFQTGVGEVSYAWADAYAGAAAMTVPNPQMALKALRVTGPADGEAAQVAGLLIAVHYALDNPGMDHVTNPWRAAQPGLFALAERAPVLAAFSAGRRGGGSWRDALGGLGDPR